MNRGQRSTGDESRKAVEVAPLGGIVAYWSMRRLANYRAGDRAEALGIVLMQLFCAVAPVPRQEDFGMGDAVATLLRKEGRFLYAEDSFLVQFKSRTERVVRYAGSRLKALLEQELPLLIARVDLTQAEIRLHSVGHALTHPNINDAQELVLHLNRVPTEIGTTLSIWVRDPVLRWTATQLADRDFEATAYAVMKRLLEFERWNRRYRDMGAHRSVHWETNQEPVEIARSFLAGGDRTGTALSEMVPTLEVLGLLAVKRPDLAPSLLALMEWFRDEGVEPDPSDSIMPMLTFSIRQHRALQILRGEPEDTIALLFDLPANWPGHYTVTETAGKLTGPWTQRTHVKASPEEVQELGFEVEVDAGSPTITAIRPGPTWLAERKCELLNEVDGVFLLRKAEPDLANT